MRTCINIFLLVCSRRDWHSLLLLWPLEGGRHRKHGRLVTADVERPSADNNRTSLLSLYACLSKRVGNWQTRFHNIVMHWVLHSCLHFALTNCNDRGVLSVLLWFARILLIKTDLGKSKNDLRFSQLLSRWFLNLLMFLPLRWRHVPPKRRLTFNGLQGVISHTK
jgi:hypothetical protein